MKTFKKFDWWGGQPAPKANKYGAKKITLYGFTFDSMGEAKRWNELILLQKVGEISNLQRQIKFVLTVNNQLICKYIADFVYQDKDGNKVVEDFKSPITKKKSEYRIKKKLMQAIYNITILETEK